MYRSNGSDLAKTVFQTALISYQESVNSARLYNQDTAFDLQVQHAEKSSRYFFRPLDGSLHRVSIEKVKLAEGSLSRIPAGIATVFRQHWGGIMGDVDQLGQTIYDPDQQHIEVLLRTIDRRLTDDEQD
ncbi:uncharacterized protein PHALS_11340 [Plasmopara halstedii]|uniref:Uncharacterized protein n=1 Tax=Plasmopara halstedii TaxID=4781 RepID=A0A0P1A5P2_PLAHL|nr:uncharacterized protein PHALS_11340 [Plasmopara halstedii]CEG35460.1 hypothetical protein PHALS_11340 [Plasmopara halstedii]|eukprot:XP_024571829.1 hypothetical protein PHALS_11340 [Plasmopara halstedii]